MNKQEMVKYISYMRETFDISLGMAVQIKSFTEYLLWKEKMMWQDEKANKEWDE